MLIIENWETTEEHEAENSHTIPTSQKLIFPLLSFQGSLMYKSILVHLLNRILSTMEQRGNNILILGKTNSLQYFQNKPKPCVHRTEENETSERNHTCSFSFTLMANWCPCFRNHYVPKDYACFLFK